MDDKETYEENSGAFSKARSHIMLILGLIVAAAAASWLESLDPEACKPEAQPKSIELSPYRV